MKFYTREKKPKVYSIAVLTAAAALLLFAVVQGAPELLLPYGNLILTVYFAGVILLLLDAFRKQLQYNPYSYNTIFYPGIALFIFSLMGTHAYVTVRCFQDPDSYRAAQMLFTLVHSAKNYMFITTPLLLLLSFVRRSAGCSAGCLEFLFRPRKSAAEYDRQSSGRLLSLF